MKPKPIIITVTVIIGILICSFTLAEQKFRLFSFDEKNALKEWQEKIFKGRVLYAVNLETKEGYLTAYSKSSSSGIFNMLSFNPNKTPMVSWKWKVVKFPDKDKKEGKRGESTWIEKDDYAVRFYIIFPGICFTTTKSLEYIWDKELPKGTIMTSPYFKNIKLIVLESGEKDLGNWVSEERNVYEDFRNAFGKEHKPKSAGAIAIMTNSNNTLSTAEAQYDEIKVGYKKDEPK